MTRIRSFNIVAWSILLRLKGYVSNPDIRRLRTLSGNLSQLSHFGFSHLHQAYLGIGPTSFGEAIKHVPRSLIDSVDCSGWTTLSWAAIRGDCHAVRQLLLYGADPNKRDRNGCGPLHYSTLGGNSACVRLLLEAKAEIDQKDYKGYSALHHAVMSLEIPFLIKVMEIFTDYGADVNAGTDKGIRPLHIAARRCRMAVFAFLIEHGADCNLRNDYGRSVLHEAIRSNNHAVIEYLLQRPGFDYGLQSKRGITIFHEAARYGDMETLFLLSHIPPGSVDLTVRDKLGWTALDETNWGRDENVRRSKDTGQIIEKKPSEWYYSFEDMMYYLCKEESGKRESGRGVYPGSDRTLVGEQNSGNSLENNGEENRGSYSQDNDELCDSEAVLTGDNENENRKDDSQDENETHGSEEADETWVDAIEIIPSTLYCSTDLSS